MSIYEARTPQYIFCFLINLLLRTIPPFPVYCVCIATSAKKTLYTVQITQTNRQMKWRPPTRVKKLFIVLHINHKQTVKLLISCCIKQMFTCLAVKTKPFLGKNCGQIHTFFNASSSSSEEASLCQTCQCNGYSERIESLEMLGGDAAKMSFPQAAISGCCHFRVQPLTIFPVRLMLQSLVPA